MKRFLIFTVLFPPLAVAVYIASDPVLRSDLPEIGLLIWVMGFAYPLAVMPAWMTAGVDLALSGRPLYVRLVATMPVAAVLAELVARYLGQPGLELTVR